MELSDQLWEAQQLFQSILQINLSAFKNGALIKFNLAVKFTRCSR